MTPSADQIRTSGREQRLDRVDLTVVHDQAVAGDQLADGDPVLQVTDAFFERWAELHGGLPVGACVLINSRDTLVKKKQYCLFFLD